MLLLRTYESNLESLTDHSYELRRNRNINIRKQSLHDRFSPAAVGFLKEVIDHQLKGKCNAEDSLVFEPFSKVFIQDSTKFGLPEQLQDDYPCYGGRAAKAGGQIQFIYELKNQKVCHLDLHPARKSESHWATNNFWIEKNSLILRDLGYFTINGFKEIIDKEAYFISKAKPKTAFYDANNTKIDLKKLMSKMKKNGLDYCEKNVIMGFEKKKKLPVRVIFCRVPDHVKEQRLRKASKNAKERKWHVTDEYKLWAEFNVFITNIPEKMISAQNIPMIYKLRWQIELIFKTWKSHHKIHLHKAVKKERIECYLYASLLLILLQSHIFSWLQKLLDKHKIGLSIHKFSKVMIHLKALFHQTILGGEAYLKKLTNMLLSFENEAFLKEKKKGKIGYTNIVYNYL